MADTLVAPQSAASSTRAASSGKPTGFYVGRFFLYAVLIFGAIVSIVPFLYTISVSLMTLTESNRGDWLPTVPQWSNYAKAWNDANFSQYFWNSVRIAAITLTGEVVFCVLAAYAFARMSFPGKSLLFSLLLATLMLPEAVIWVPNFITVSWLGRVGPIPWMNSWPALTIPFMASAFNIFLLRQFFQQIPNDLWDSAQIDGAGHLRYLWSVVVPLSRSPIMTVLLFSFIASWNSLAWPLLVTTTPDWRPISYGLLSFLDEYGNQFHLQMAGAVITMLPIVVLYFFTQKTFIESVATTGLKG